MWAVEREQAPLETLGHVPACSVMRIRQTADQTVPEVTQTASRHVRTESMCSLASVVVLHQSIFGEPLHRLLLASLPFFFCRLPSLEASLVTFPNFWWRHLHSSLTHTSSFDVRHCCPAHRKYTACCGLGVGTLILGRSRREKLGQLLEKYQSFTRVQNLFA